LLLQNEYLTAENPILQAHLPTQLHLSDLQIFTLADIGKRLGRKGLEHVAVDLPMPATPRRPPELLLPRRMNILSRVLLKGGAFHFSSELLRRSVRWIRNRRPWPQHRSPFDRYRFMLG
jgi:hypothetical protein